MPSVLIFGINIRNSIFIFFYSLRSFRHFPVLLLVKWNQNHFMVKPTPFITFGSFFLLLKLNLRVLNVCLTSHQVWNKRRQNGRLAGKEKTSWCVKIMFKPYNRRKETCTLEIIVFRLCIKKIIFVYHFISCVNTSPLLLLLLLLLLLFWG